MDTTPFSPGQFEAFRTLLDDTSPCVRQHLLGYFQSRGESAKAFLDEIATGHHRALAWHARWFLAELKFDDPVSDFQAFIRSLNYALETGAILLSRTVLPDTDAGACCTELDRLAARCRELIAEPTTARERCRVISRVLFHEEGFRGNIDHYTDPLNSLLPQVLVRRKGIPLTLSLVYLLVAQRIGLQLEPVGLPGHLLVGCFEEDAPFYIDPFEQGAFRTANDLYAFIRATQIAPQPAHLAPTPVREVLCRCCRNLSHHYDLAGDNARAALFRGFVAEFEAAYERHTA